MPGFSALPPIADQIRSCANQLGTFALLYLLDDAAMLAMMFC